MPRIESLGHEVLDLGHDGQRPADYPIYGRRVGEAVVSGVSDLGIVICGTGVGIGIAAGTVPGVRCACCSEPYTAVLSREHNDANVLAIGARVVGEGMALMIVEAWLAGRFDGERHARRLALLNDLAARRSAAGGQRGHPA